MRLQLPRCFLNGEIIYIITLRNGKSSKSDLPYPGMMFTTPGGKPASLIKLASFKAVKGVISEGYEGISIGIIYIEAVRY